MKQAKVAAVIDEYKVVLNVGETDGLSGNEDFILYRQGPEIIDPDTGDSLGIFEQVIGRGVVTYVQEKMSTLESSEITEGGKRIVKKRGAWATILSPEIEEVVEMPDKAKPFKNARVGDLAKRI